MYGYVRVCAVVPSVSVADPVSNLNKIDQKLSECESLGANIVVFPELSVTGYTCGDLFGQLILLEKSNKVVASLVRSSADHPFVICVGAPVLIDGELIDASLVIASGKICGIVPKTFLNLEDSRCFISADSLCTDNISSIELGSSESYDIPVGNNLLFSINGKYKFGIEIGEDIKAVIPPSASHILSGAEIILNPSAFKAVTDDDILSLAEYRSMTGKCAYVSVSAGSNESTTNYVCSGKSIIAENGKIIECNDKTVDNDYIIASDIDLDVIRSERLRSKRFGINRSCACVNCTEVEIFSASVTTESDGSLRIPEKLPFVPSAEYERFRYCSEIFDIQVESLKKRLSFTGCRPVIGVSGGLDSSLALLVCVSAVKSLNKPASDVVGITMPCFGTSNRTYNNSLKLMQALGVTMKEINIKESCLQHFNDIGHDVGIHDGTYENSQARERTQVLMDFAGSIGGMVIGTGDLSELSLGWCTYNGDHMSMYGVNAGIPKTLLKYMMISLAQSGEYDACAEILLDIVDTPISPELLPADNGKISQQTEDIVGPYILHDFFIYFTLRYGFSPAKVYCLACNTFAGDYEKETVKKWLKTFYKRFFGQQFKRNCMPDGAKISDISLSPRGDWNMPSDAVASLWLREAEEL